ncbi:MAG: oxidoreductase [Acidobacteriota bacterium]|nr:oxidoreductase [Acidobacteriota bacterium]MDH3528526.1 oxidoreductase [Acidobacteriota bacterium]
MSKANWTTENIPSQQGKVAIVTGSSSGIGFEAARIIAGKGATTIIAVRNAIKGEKAIGQIHEEFEDSDLRLMILDLSSLESVRIFADEYKREFEHLDCLINNAGVMVPPYSKTEDGFELQIGTNHLGHFALTSHLLDLLEATEGARVVNVSSNAHKMGNLDFEDLNWENRNYNKWRAYGDSKIANLYFTSEFNRRNAASGGTAIATAAHPGWTATELQRNTSIAGLLNHVFAQEGAMGALPTLRAAFDPEANAGDYFGPKGFMEMGGYPVRVEMSDRAKDADIAGRLWEVSEEMTGVTFGFGAIGKGVTA